jgi:1-acyl-sn-glycerol-3-phosphate acyltransferase
LFGWRLGDTVPSDVRKAVMIAAPHTSNWDLPFMVWTAWAMGVRMRWMGKHTLFRFPYGWIMRGLGGMPIDRRSPHGVVAQSATKLMEADDLILTVPAEGTRSFREFWKSGFYAIAHQAQVPILLGYVDFGAKEGGVGPAVMPTGDVVADMDKIRAFYSKKVGKLPEKSGPIRLRAEEHGVWPPPTDPQPAALTEPPSGGE